MDKLLNTEIKLNEMSPLALAYVGDGVFDLFVREFLISRGNCPVKKLHQRAVEMVKAEAQSSMLKKLLEENILTEAEVDICKRGRNARVSHIPKHAEIADYHNATALECLFGYLYLDGRLDRLRELFALVKAGY